MARLQRAMIVYLSVIAPQNNEHYFVTGCQVSQLFDYNATLLAVLAR